MSAFFFDSSGIVKRFVNEAGSAWTINLIKPLSGNRIYIARITHAEVVSAIERRRRDNSLSTAHADKALLRFERSLAGRYLFVEIRPIVVETAASLAKKHPLRGFDSVQLAAALFANAQRLSIGASALTFISADNRLNNAAQAEGLATDNPNNHP